MIAHPGMGRLSAHPAKIAPHWRRQLLHFCYLEEACRPTYMSYMSFSKRARVSVSCLIKPSP